MKNHADEDVVIYLIGNKIDLKDKRVITKQQGEKLAIELNSFHETSATSSDNIKDIFRNLLKCSTFYFLLKF